MTPPSGASDKKEESLKPCGHHPGMSCQESHLDDAIQINELKKQIAPLKTRSEELENQIDIERTNAFEDRMAWKESAKSLEKQLAVQQMTLDSQASTIEAWVKKVKELREREKQWKIYAAHGDQCSKSHDFVLNGKCWCGLAELLGTERADG